LAACRPTHKATRTANRRPARQRHRHGSGWPRELRRSQGTGAHPAQRAAKWGGCGENRALPRAQRPMRASCSARWRACAMPCMIAWASRFHLALPQLVVASRRTLGHGHGLHSNAGSPGRPGSAEQAHCPGSMRATR
jgi:hypothetical protein